MLGREIDEARYGYLAPTVTERGTPGWLLVVEGYRPEMAMGDRTIAPLVRLPLLGLRPDDSGCLIVTQRGSETWQRFCHLGGRYPEDLIDIYYTAWRRSRLAASPFSFRAITLPE